MFGIWILKIVTSMMCRSQKKSHKKSLKKTAIKRYNMLMTSTSVRPKAIHFAKGRKEKVTASQFCHPSYAILACLFFRFLELFFLLFFN